MYWWAVTGQQPSPQQQQQQQQQSVVVVNTSASRGVTVTAFGDSPVQTTCPHCQNTVFTSVTYEIGALAWIIFFVLCILGYAVTLAIICSPTFQFLST